jgi:hypothetical protein
MAMQIPGVGAWYRLNGGPPFEVVALDDHDGTIEVQYVDGTLEELDLEDWKSWCDEHALEATDAGEDWSDSADVEADEGHSRFIRPGDNNELKAGSLDDIDIFDVG